MTKNVRKFQMRFLNTTSLNVFYYKSSLQPSQVTPFLFPGDRGANIQCVRAEAYIPGV